MAAALRIALTACAVRAEVIRGNNYALRYTKDSCTTIIVGKKASADGSVMCTHSNDGEGFQDPRLVHIPAADHPQGTMRPIFFAPESYPRYVGTARLAELCGRELVEKRLLGCLHSRGGGPRSLVIATVWSRPPGPSGTS